MRSVLLFLLLSSFAWPQAKPVAISDEPHHHLLFDNKYARVYSLVLPPLASTELHSHASDFVRVLITDGRLRITTPGSGVQLRTQNAALTQFRPAGPKHVELNEDSFATYREVLVEVVKPGIYPGVVYDYATYEAVAYDSFAGPTSPDAAFRIAHVTPTVDGIDMQILANGSNSTGACNAGCLLVALTDLKLQSKDGTTMQLAKGEVSWNEWKDDHLLKNVSQSAARFIVLKFK